MRQDPISIHVAVRCQAYKTRDTPRPLLHPNHTTPLQTYHPWIHLLHCVSSLLLAMMVCTTCKGLQKHWKPEGIARETEAGALHLVDTTLPALRSSATGCRACGLLLQGILLHHDRFKNVKENDISVTADSFRSEPERNSQDHLSVEARWKEQHDDDEHEHDEQGHAGWPNLKLEFFTDGGKFPLQPARITCPSYRRHLRGCADHLYIRLSKDMCG